MDISSLYSQLTVDAQRYQELHRSDLAAKATDRWPLLKEVRGGLHGGREQDRSRM
jgi:hypothetical protein